MEFLQQNMIWVGLAVVSGGMLIWPLIAGGTVASLTPAEATLMMNREDAVVLDVRETGEWGGGHIGGARHITLGQLAGFPSWRNSRNGRSSWSAPRATVPPRPAAISRSTVSARCSAWGAASPPGAMPTCR